MILHPTRVQGAFLIEPATFADERGSFTEVYQLGALAERGWRGSFVRSAISHSHARGVQNYRRSGEVDAMRIPKDSYFAHQVMWDGWVQPEQSHAHLLGHWNYTNGTVKSIIAVCN